MTYRLGVDVGGTFTDLLLVDGDPLADVDILRDRDRLLAIMKGGEFHKRPARRAGSLDQPAE